jgi:hypothetical protein
MSSIDRVASALEQFVIEPVRKKSSALFLLQISQLITDRGGGRYDAFIQRGLSLLRPKVSLPPSGVVDELAIDGSVVALKQRGWDILPWQLPAEDVAELHRFAFTTPAYAKHPAERIAIIESNIPTRSGRYTWRMSELIRVPAVQRLVADGALHTIAQEYLGCRPILTTIAMWLNPPYEGSYNAHVYHYDNAGPSFLKFFVYLNDIDSDAAHTFIQGTHRHLKPRQFGRAGLYNRDKLLAFYGAENEIAFTGPAGMILAEDTAGFHKGTTPSKGYRLLLELQFTSLDDPQEEEFVCGIDKVRIANLDPSIKRIARKFFI